MNNQITKAAHILAGLAHHNDDSSIKSDIIGKGFGTNLVAIRLILPQLKKAYPVVR